MQGERKNWKKNVMPCLVCGRTVVGYLRGEGEIKYRCPYCKAAMVRKVKGRRHFTVECYFSGAENDG
jgi:predicted RNA-binding Zn-ribbon protein involved in translation (DUF1610 family)